MEASAAELARQGLGEGNRLGILLTTDAGFEAIILALGALECGAVVVPLNTRWSPEEITHAIELVEPAAIVSIRERQEHLGILAHSAPIWTLTQAASDGSVALNGPSLSGKPPPSKQPEGPDALACLLFTSGTTARSKAVMHTHATMIATGLCCGTALELKVGDRYQGAFPFFTSSALNLACMSCWVTGACLVYEDMLDNEGRIRLIEQEGTSFYHGVPTTLQFLLEEYLRGGYDLSGLRRIAYGGAAMPLEITERMEQAWPWLEQVQIYGQTESGPSGSVLRPDMMHAKPGSLGCAMPFCKLEVIDEEGVLQPPGTIGEIAIAGPAIAMGYYRNEEATKAAFSDRRIRTGDAGYLDENGYLFFTDRKKDIINRGGFKVSSVAVESVLYRHPSIREAAVVAIPHSHLGEDVAACVVPVSGITPDFEELTAFCRERMADDALPRRWLVLDALPKNAMGKIMKAELRTRILDAQ
jgi:acyl-CoA synthetase (AMP-forming)/AMP-acid ligase II